MKLAAQSKQAPSEKRKATKYKAVVSHAASDFVVIHCSDSVVRTVSVASSPVLLPLHFPHCILDLKPHEENREKAWYHSYIIKLHGGLDHDIHGLSSSILAMCTHAR